MLNRVLVGTDLSEPSLAVLDYLPRLKEVGLEEVVLAHIVFTAGTMGVEQMLIDQAKEVIAEQARCLREAELEVKTVVQMGVAAPRLAHLAEEYEASAIVVGSHGHSMLKRMLLGSVAMSLLHHATVPVLIVRMDLRDTDDGVACRVPEEVPETHLLFPTDFSDAADEAFQWLKEFAAETDARVTLLHAQDIRAFDHEIEELEEFNEEDRERLAALADELRAAGVSEVVGAVERGSPAEMITSRAAEDGASMVVMATRGRGALQELVLGSVALRVARTSPVPVMMIPKG